MHLGMELYKYCTMINGLLNNSCWCYPESPRIEDGVVYSIGTMFLKATVFGLDGYV